MIVPPLNFALVVDDVYRSGHPLPVNYSFLETLQLKTIVYVGDRTAEESKDYIEWAESRGIKLVRFHVESVKEPFVENDPEAMTAALEYLLDTRQFPVLVHSNKGKHRVGVLVGAMRKMLMGWSLSFIFDEYSRFAQGKGEADLQFIESFAPELECQLRYAPSWLRFA